MVLHNRSSFTIRHIEAWLYINFGESSLLSPTKILVKLFLLSYITHRPSLETDLRVNLPPRTRETGAEGWGRTSNKAHKTKIPLTSLLLSSLYFL